MTIGIYKLSFPNTDLIYIGQSVNIEDRYRQHCYVLSKNESNSKLQYAYNLYGKPSIETLRVCSIEDLDTWEIQYISLFDTLDKGLNTLPGGSSTPDLKGICNPNAQYKDEDYYNVLYFLGEPGYSVKEIETLTGVSRYVIAHISALESHSWLKDKYPEEYKKLEDIAKGSGRKSAFMQGIFYPKIRSPAGEIYEVQHQTNFAKEHGLLQPKLCEVLKGTRKSHKGWSLA